MLGVRTDFNLLGLTLKESGSQIKAPREPRDDPGLGMFGFHSLASKVGFHCGNRSGGGGEVLSADAGH